VTNDDVIIVRNVQVRTFLVGTKPGSWGRRGTLTVSRWHIALDLPGLFTAKQALHIYRDDIDGLVSTSRTLFLGNGLLWFAGRDGLMYQFRTSKHADARAACDLLCSPVSGRGR
jgi:hypothetical protein